MAIDATALQAEWRASPMQFIRDVIDDYPRWEQQVEILEAVRDHRYVLVKSPHGMGKSFVASDIVLWFLCSFPDSIVITTAPSWPQVEKILWAELNQKAKNLKLKSLGLHCLQTEARFDDKWFAIGLSPKVENADQGARITGFHAENILVVFDEGPSVHSALWKFKETILTSANSRFLAIGNPIRSDGDFYEAFKSEHAKRISISLFRSPNFAENGIHDLPALLKLAKMPYDERVTACKDFKTPFPFLSTPMWAVDRVLEWGADSPIFEARVLGEFPTKTTDTIIAYSECEHATLAEPAHGTRVMGVDVARFGSDYTVIFGYEGGRRIFYSRRQGQDLVQTAEMIKAEIQKADKKQRPYYRIVIDDTGLGGGVTDILTHWLGEREANHTQVIPVNFAEAAVHGDVYSGIVTEMYYTARDYIREGRIQIKDEGELISDLSGRKYDFKNGLFRIEPKEAYKKRTGRSPDEGDAFVLAVWGMAMGDVQEAPMLSDDDVVYEDEEEGGMLV